MFSPPEHALGADLLWWRVSGGMRTMATLLWGRAQSFKDQLHIHAVLFDSRGKAVAEWQVPLVPDQPIFLDSTADGPWRVAQATDGVLALYACTDGEPSNEARQHYNRLFPLVEWERADGALTTLHSDQTVRRGRTKVQEFTEIVISETTDERNALVLLNGEESQPVNALQLTFKNATGAARSATYASTMAPFTAHRVLFADLLKDIVEFAAGQPLVVSGQFTSTGLYSRPYIETTGAHWGVYHAGDVYHWSELPFVAHAIIGGEVNPVPVLHDANTRTLVNILHSHGSLEADVAVDARLFDASGKQVAHRHAWRIAARHSLSRGDISELLPDPARPFRGHVALSFAPSRGQPAPRHLQALIEYRHAGSVARVMTWSDEWNSPVRLARRNRTQRPAIYRSWFRVRQEEHLSTELAISNPGHSSYDRIATVHATWLDSSGSRLEKSFNLAPYATMTASITELFPDATGRSAPPLRGVLLLESASDLACVGFTRNHSIASLAAEHFLWLYSEHEGLLVLPSGS